MTEETKKQKTIMESFRIDEISGVDRPAQEGARALLIKRAELEEDAFEKMLKSAGLMLTSDEKGHSHLVDSTEDGGSTSRNRANGAEMGHSHPWVKKSDGTIQIGMADGHGHSVLEKKFELEDDGYSKRDFSAEDRRRLAKEGKAMPDGSFPIVNVADLRNAIQAFGRAKAKGPVAKHIKRRARALGAEKELPKEGLLALKSVNGEGLQKEQETMTDKNEKTVETVEKELQEVQDELAVAKAFGAMNDAEKAHYNGLGSDEQAAFLKLDADGRKSLIEKAAGEDPVVYTDADGNDYRKSDDPRTVASAKRADKAEKMAKAEREKREDTELEKRAESELDKLPGEMDVKKALLKAVNSIEDEKLRDGVNALLKAGNAGLEDAFRKRGERGEGQDSSLNDEYEKLAEEYAKEHECTIEIARADVLTETKKGRELAKRMEDERKK